ncbi:MAG: hypothetical protein ACM3U1_06970 [Chloroflexota bacterium]
MTKKFLVPALLAAILLAAAPGTQLRSQGDEAFRIKLESIFYKFKNYRFSTISIYRLRDIKDIRNAIKAREDAQAGGGEVKEGNADCVNKADRAITSLVESEVNQGASFLGVQRALLTRGLDAPADLQCIYDYYMSRTQVAVKQIKNVYAVTTRMSDRDQMVPSTIIGVIVSYDDNEDIKRNVDPANPTNIFTYPELVSFELDPGTYRANNLYELVQNSFRQNNVENKTLEAQGIGTFMRFAPPKYGTSLSLISSEAEITSYDVQNFIRISEGQPQQMTKNNEVIVSPDLISWRQYQGEYYTNEDGTVDTISSVTNHNLPKIGVELRYGIEEINYPSLWSERLTLSALWKNVKLGLILPTAGWSSMTSDLFEVERKLTHGGTGVAGQADFPMPVIPNSGIFHFSLGYVFGNAKPASYKNRDLTPDNFPTGGIDPTNLFYNDYLVRFNGQFHYTFGIAIDDDYLLRFGIGATAYTMERWTDALELNPETGDKVVFRKAGEETVGGLSGKIEFMSTNVSTPYGASAQYFDEGIYGNVWLQIPVIENTFALRLDAKGYFKPFADEPRPWENDSVFLPSARLIVNF